MLQIQAYRPLQLREFHDRNRPDAAHPIGADDLAAFLREPGRWRKTEAGLVVPGAQDLANRQSFLQTVYDGAGFKTPIVVPPLPRITDKQKTALARFGLEMFYLPAIGEDAYPNDWVKPAWGKYLTMSNIQRRALPGKWIAVETIAKCDWNDPVGYGGGNDPVTAALRLAKRFAISWDDHHARRGTLARFAKLGGFPKQGTRFGTAEEANFIGNLCNLLREKHGQAHLPNLGQTNSWEWCENTCESGNRLVVGDSVLGGLSAVRRDWLGVPYVSIAFRVLVVL